MWKLLLSSVFLITLIRSSSSLPIEKIVADCPLRESPGRVEVFITISSLAVSTTKQGVVKRQLELNWVSRDPQPADRVGLYDRDPEVEPDAQPLHSLDPAQHQSGFFRSDIEIPVLFFNLSCLVRDPCLGYWVAYKSGNGSVLSSSCLQTRPFWMERSGHFLGSLRLHEVMIPGSHDSGSFCFHREYAPIAKFKYAQEEPIFNQLVYGLRYFDFRVGYYRKSKDKYYINHNFLRTEHSLKSVLHQVVKFVRATQEIIILDFHNFPVGFTNEIVHFNLVRLIVNQLGKYLIPTSYTNHTFSQLWKEKKRVLVSYDNSVRNYFHHKVLWPAISRAWGNKQHPEELRKYFEDVFSKPVPSTLWASMAELTPNAKAIVLHPDTGLRIFADEVNRNVTHWFRDLYWKKANIVATDYFMGNNIIDVAIEKNRLKALCLKSAWTKDD